jgi:hypothetical protein
MRPCRRALSALSVVAVWSAMETATRAEPPAPASPPPAPYAAPMAAPPAPMAAPPAPADPHDEVLRRLLRSGCRDGLAEARALAASGAVTWADTVARLCGEILRAAPAPHAPGARVDRDGRGTMVIFSTLYGIWVGIATDVLFTVTDPRGIIVPPLIGMGAGLGLSLLLTGDHPLTNGQAWTIVTGLEYGSANGALWAGAFDFSATTVVGATLATGVGAGTIGLLVSQKMSPSQGDVEVVRSGLLWGTVGGLLTMLTIATDGTSQSYLRGAGVSMDLGLLGGLALAASFDVSRNRDLIIDAGFLGGGVAGFGLTLLIEGANSDGRSYAAGALAGMVAGAVTAIYLTRHMDDPDEESGPTVAALLGRDARGRWSWGTPGPTPVLDGLGHRIIGATFTALGGEF